VTSLELLLFALIALPFLGSCLAVLFRVDARDGAAYFAGLIALTALALTIATYPHVTSGEVLQYRYDWVPELGLHFSLRMDGFAWIFAALITGIGFLVVLYARYYMSSSDPVPRFFAFLLAFMGAMLGIVLSGNVIQLVFFWELTICALLHVLERSCSSILCILAGLHGGNARNRALWKRHSVGLFLGTDQPLLLLADRLLVPERSGA